jgi:hypothetical protein
MPATDWDLDKLLPIVTTTKSNPISCALAAAVVRKKLVQLSNITGLEKYYTYTSRILVKPDKEANEGLCDKSVA